MLIAQLTDTHIKLRGRLAYNRVDTASMLRQAIAHLQSLPQQPDLVLITGDLVDQGHAGEYDHLLEILAPLQQRLLLVPGNHDDRDIMRHCFEQAYLDAAQPFWQFSIQEDHWPLRIIGLDTVDPGSSAGLLCQRRLDWLANALRQSGQTPTLLMMHHPPFVTGIGHMDDIGLSGREALCALLVQHPNVELIVCGHLHRNIRASAGGRPVMTAPSTAHTVQLDIDPKAKAFFNMEPAGYLLHWWNGQTLVTHHVNAASYAGPYPFFEDSGDLIT